MFMRQSFALIVSKNLVANIGLEAEAVQSVPVYSASSIPIFAGNLESDRFFERDVMSSLYFREKPTAKGAIENILSPAVRTLRSMAKSN